jgi:hypothetical protein
MPEVIFKIFLGDDAEEMKTFKKRYACLGIGSVSTQLERAKKV